MSAPSEDPELLFELRADGVAVITLNRPRAKNTVSFTMWEQFSAALDRLEPILGGRRLQR